MSALTFNVLGHINHREVHLYASNFIRKTILPHGFIENG
ncbi:arsenate reductase [Salmonella enterica]|nr:arsenate reductase [Salmonella enterica]